MEINVKLDCEGEEAENIKKVMIELLNAMRSKRFFVHISKLEDENTDIYSSSCVMKNTVVMKEMSLVDVVNLQKKIDNDILEERRNQNEY